MITSVNCFQEFLLLKFLLFLLDTLLYDITLCNTIPTFIIVTIIKNYKNILAELKHDVLLQSYIE